MPNSTDTQLVSTSPQIQETNYNILQPTSESLPANQLVLPVLNSTPSIDRDWSNSAQELIDGLPRIWTRGLLYLLIGFVGIVLPWASLAQVDETGSARGRLEPKGTVYRLDAPVTGTVVQVRVREGETVKTGQVLLELDSEIIRTELKQAEDKLQGQIAQLSQLKILKDQLFLALATQKQQNQAQDLEVRAQIEQLQQNLNTLASSYFLQKEEKIAQIDQIRQTVQSNQTASSIAAIGIAIAQREVQRFQAARQEGIVSEVSLSEKQDLLQQKQQLFEQAKADIQQAQLRLTEQQISYQRTIHQAEAEIKQAKLRLKEKEKNYQSWLNAGKLAIFKSEEELKNRKREITAIEAEIAQNKGQIAALKLQLAQRSIKAPANGIIFELPIARTGAVVQPSQMVAQIAPEKTPLVLKAQMPSQESGFLRLEMPVKIKFDAYPFQDYGVVEGKLSRIAPDSTIQEIPQGQIEVFEVEITLNQPYIHNQNKRIPLTAGQTATAEVIVRQRRVIDFILDPLKKLQQGGLEL